MIDLSIVIPTLNRSHSLAACLTAAQAAATCSSEIIVVDGASSDGTGDVLKSFSQAMGDRLRIIREPNREGFVRAANKGFRAARGRYLMWLNDDARPLPGSLDRAIEQLEFYPRSVGKVALFHPASTTRNIAFEAIHMGRSYRLLHVRGTLYAYFGIARRQTFERINYFDERFYLNAPTPISR